MNRTLLAVLASLIFTSSQKPEEPDFGKLIIQYFSYETQLKRLEEEKSRIVGEGWEENKAYKLISASPGGYLGYYYVPEEIYLLENWNLKTKLFSVLLCLSRMGKIGNLFMKYLI